MLLTRPLTRRRLLAGSGALLADTAAASAAAGIVARLIGPWTGIAAAGGNPDVRILQTAMSVDNALGAAYETAIGVARGPGAAPGVIALLTAAQAHHADHVLAWADALGRLGGATQSAANPAVADLFGQRGGRSGPLLRVLGALAAVESVAAQTAQRAVGLLGDPGARNLAAAVAGTEHQHGAALAIALLLAEESKLDLLTPGRGATPDLPPATAARAIPRATTTTDEARPPAEGAVG